jgi:hypothetical protein
VLPEIRDQIRAVRARERACEARLIVGVGGHDLGAGRGECLRFVRVGLARDRAHGESAVGVSEDGACEAAALRSGGADDGDDFSVRHG